MTGPVVTVVTGPLLCFGLGKEKKSRDYLSGDRGLVVQMPALRYS